MRVDARLESQHYVNETIRILRSGLRFAVRRPQVSSGECETGTRLEILLERYGALLVAERDDDIGVPWPAVCGVRTAAGIVCGETCVDVDGHSSVITTRYGGQPSREGWLANGPPSLLRSFGGQPSWACQPKLAPCGSASERRLVGQTVASWNRIANWLSRIKRLQEAARAY
jgi:hypothetical protein